METQFDQICWATEKSTMSSDQIYLVQLHARLQVQTCTIEFFPLMYWYELFLVKFLRNPETRLNISENVVFSSTKTRSASYFKLTCHCSGTNLSWHFYFNRVCRLWNVLPPIDLNLSSDILKLKIRSFLWSFFIKHFNPHIPCTFHFVCPCARCMSSPLPTNYPYLYFFCFIHCTSL